MWSLVVSALLIAVGVVLVLHGSRSLDAARERQDTLLFSTVATLTSNITDNGNTQPSTSFLTSASFATAMDAPVYTSFYLYNLTNAVQVLAGTEAPRVQQIGPYTYEKRSRKVNVAFHVPPPSPTASPTASSYGTVTYQVATTYTFAPTRSNGSASNTVVTLNASYARRLAKLRVRGASERFVVAEFAQQHVRNYTQYLQTQGVAAAKLRAWTHFLPALLLHAQHEALRPALVHQQQRVASHSIAPTLVRMFAVARTASIPIVLADVAHDVAYTSVPALLQQRIDAAKRHALPRVLSNVHDRLLVESVPFWLVKQQQLQHQQLVPHALASFASNMEAIAFPYVLHELFERACVEAVPSLLRSIKSELVAQDIALRHVAADVAQRNVVDRWRRRIGIHTQQPIDMDAWIDDAPTGVPRTGFEVMTSSSTDEVELSLEAATLILGSKPSNVRFSIVEYDPEQAALYRINDALPTTPEGFGIWKQVLAMNETAIDYVINGVNADVALVSDYITRAQLLRVRLYLLEWTTSPIVQRDRERRWRQRFDKRTAQSDHVEARVDVDLEAVGVQTGFTLQLNGPSVSSVTAAIAQTLWSPRSACGITDPQGFTLWHNAMQNDATSVQLLVDNVAGLTPAHVAEVIAWLFRLQLAGVIKRRALRHWSDGTCLSVVGLRLAQCVRYDLEPHVVGLQIGFEMNPEANRAWRVPQSLRATLWDRSSAVTFLQSTSTSGYRLWRRGIRTRDYMRVVTDARESLLTEAIVDGVVQWLVAWSRSPLQALVVHDWWRASTCWPRQVQRTTAPTITVLATGVATCIPSYTEVETASTCIEAATTSPFFVFDKTIAVDETQCVVDAATALFTQQSVSYSMSVRTFSCDVSSTALAAEDDDDSDADPTAGFELMPLATTANERLSLAAAIVLWDPANAVSFVHVDGYKRWFELPALSSSLPDDAAATLLQSINAAIDATCATQAIDGGGDRSAVFNRTFAATERCGHVTLTQMDAVRSYVIAQRSNTWIRNALLDQWRRGAANEFEVEPYRSGDQRGYEVAAACATRDCVRTPAHGTLDAVPRAALRLWDTRDRASFLHVNGWLLWAALVVVPDEDDEADAAAVVQAAQDAVVAACQATAWLPWMQRVVDWLGMWLASDHVLRDVVGHWQFAQCRTTPERLAVLSRVPGVATAVTACRSEYSIALRDSIVDLQTRASRPTTFFDPNVVEHSARVQPTQVVEVDETWRTCVAVDSSSGFQQTITAQTSRVQFQACNLLSVLSDPAVVTQLTTRSGSGSFAPLHVAPIDARFELNSSSVSTATLSIDVALLLWNASSAFALTNATALTQLWRPALTVADALQQLQQELTTAAAVDPTTTTPTDLTGVLLYIEQWATSASAIRCVGQSWLSQDVRSLLDLDLTLDGVQTGLELFPSGAWKRVAGDAVANLPTSDQAQYLWRTSNRFSFLHTGSLQIDQLPTGFAAWQAIDDGVDFSSERLVSRYPLDASVEYDNAAMHQTLSTAERATLLQEMATQTTLTPLQLRGVARWLMQWANNVVLRNAVLRQWATGTSAIDLTSLLLSRVFGIHESTAALLSPDKFTVASPLVATLVSRAARSRLWDVYQSGSLLHPTTQIVWCTIVVQSDENASNKRVCPWLLDAFGKLSSAALAEYKRVVAPVLQIEMMRHSNVTQLSIAFVQQQLGIDDVNAIVTIANWWRQLPTSSSFFRVSQLRSWRASAAINLHDPIRFGFDLGFVFGDSRSHVVRNATASDLVPNTVTLVLAREPVPLSACSESLELLLALWDATNALSFLHPIGMRFWRRFMAFEIDATAFLQLLAASSDALTVHAMRVTQQDDVVCMLEAMRKWLVSWQQHPFAYERVESLWIERQPIGLAAESPASLLSADAHALLRAFPLDTPQTQAADATDDVDNASQQAEQQQELWARVARTLLDATQQSSIVHVASGAAMWHALLVDCMRSDATTGACCNASSQSLTSYQRDVRTATVARTALAQVLLDEMQAFGNDLDRSSLSLLKLDVIELMLEARVVPWMRAWLDDDLFYAFVLDHAIAIDPSLAHQQPLTIQDLAIAQFVNATATRLRYVIPTTLDNMDALGVASSSSSSSTSTAIDAGVASERFSYARRVFNATSQTVELQNAPTLAGYGELAAFCAFNSDDVAFAYDATTVCGFNTAYVVPMERARALVALFADDTLWEWPRSTTETATSALPPTTRAALLIDAFLAQPFASTLECDAVVVHVAVAYALTGQQIQHACVADPAAAADSRIYLELPMLANVGLTIDARRFVTDLQAYLRYAATKFGYEPRILRLRPTAAAAATSTTTLVDPIGGYFAVATVSHVLFGRADNNDDDDSDSMGMWTNDSDARRFSSQTFTMQVPLRNDSALFATKRRVIGELLAIDHATSVTIAGARVPLNASRLTDGSQFTTAVVASKHASSDFPPQKLLFYWDHARRFVEAHYTHNVTRFGVTLLRYTIPNWRAPTAFPSGLLANVETPAPMLNMSWLFDDLPLALSSLLSPVESSDESPDVSTIDVDPLTGVVLHRRLVWQLSAFVTRDAQRDAWHRRMSMCWLPVVSVHEQASVSSSSGLALAALVHPGPLARENVALLEVVGGGVAIAIGVTLAIIHARRQRLLRLHRLQAVRPEPTATLLFKDEQSALATSTVSSTSTSDVHGKTDVTRDALAARVSSSDTRPARSSNAPTPSSRASRGQKQTQPRVQTIVEQTDGIGIGDSFETT